MHKVYDSRDREVLYTVRVSAGTDSDYNGRILRSLEYCEGDAESEDREPDESEWLPGTPPALSHPQWAALCMWICAPGGPGSPYTDEDAA